MAAQYRLELQDWEGTMVQRVHTPRYWRSHAKETLSIAEQMTDPECKKLLVSVAETYTQLARRAAAAEAAKGNKRGGQGRL